MRCVVSCSSTSFPWLVLAMPNSLSGVRKMPKTMGQSLWINISDKPQTFYKCCMNENCQLSNKEYLCWVSFWFVTFLWEETKFNATFILTHRCTLPGTIFSLSRKGPLHFTASSGANSYWTKLKFCSLSEQILLFNLAFEIAWISH